MLEVKPDSSALYGTPPVTPRIEQKDQATSDVVGSFLRTDVGVFGAVEGLVDMYYKPKFVPQEGYDPYDDMVGYEGYVSDLSDAVSPVEMSHLKMRIDDELELKQQYAAGTALQQTMAIGLGVLSDPLNLIPGAGAVHKTYRTSGRILEGGAKTAAIVGATELGNEALLQQNQITRTEEESLYNIAGASFIGGLLGGAAGFFSPGQLEELASRVEVEFTTPKFDSNKLEEDSVGAARAPATTAEDLEIANLKRANKLNNKVPSFANNPVLEVGLSPSKVVRQLGEDLADMSLALRKNYSGDATRVSVEAEVKSWDVPQVKANDVYMDNYKAYRKRAKAGLLEESERIGSGRNGMLTKDEFANEITFAGRRNDEHIIPEISTIAKSEREIDNLLLTKSQEVGLLDGVDAHSVETAQSWKKRIWDRTKIMANYLKFEEVNFQYMRRLRSEAQMELDEIKRTIKHPTEAKKKEIATLEYRAARLDSDLRDIAREITSRIANDTAGRLPYEDINQGRLGGRFFGQRGSVQQRVYTIPDEMVEDFLVNDFMTLRTSSIRQMAPDIALMRRFGTMTYDENLDPTSKIIRGIRDDYDQLVGKAERATDDINREYDKLVREAADNKKKMKLEKERQKLLKDAADVPKNVQKLKKQMEKDIRNVKALWDLNRGRYNQNPSDDYASPWRVAERSAMALNFSIMLGGVVVSSLADISRAVTHHGFRRAYGDLIKNMITDFNSLKMAKDEMRELGTMLDIANSMTAMQRANLDEHMPLSSKVDKAMMGVAQFTSKWSGINHWNSFQRTISGISTQSRMLDAINNLANGKSIPEAEMVNLSQHFIGVAEAKKIAAMMKKHSEKRGNVWIANARIWEDTQIAELFRTAVRTQIDEIILVPGMHKPLWMSKAGWRILGQFRSFNFAAQQRILLASLQKADANVMQGVAAAIPLGAMVYAIKQKLNDRPVSDDPRVWIMEGIDRSGVAGLMFEYNNLLEKASAGHLGVNRLVGGPPMSRYAQRNAISSLLGPSYGTAAKLLGVTGAMSRAATGGDPLTHDDWHAAMTLVPGNNIPWFRGMYESVANATGEAMGIPMEE